MKENVVIVKSFALAVQVISLCRYLIVEKKYT
jgi:hypothetical protein